MNDMSGAARLADVAAVLEQLYDPRWAESWDAVGLVAGDPEAEVRRVLFAVDPVAARRRGGSGVGRALVDSYL